MVGDILMVSGTAWIGDALGRFTNNGDEMLAFFHALIDGFVTIPQWVCMHIGEIDQAKLWCVGSCLRILI